MKIVKTARERNVDLIEMSTHGYSVFYRFLLGSVTAKVLHESDCPVWTDAHLEETPAREFSIRRVLCSVDLTPTAPTLCRWPPRWPRLSMPRFTLVHITAGVEFYGPGGSHVEPVWKERIVGAASEEIAKLQQNLGTNAEVIIDSGNVRSC